MNHTLPQWRPCKLYRYNQTLHFGSNINGNCGSVSHPLMYYRKCSCIFDYRILNNLWRSLQFPLYRHCLLGRSQFDLYFFVASGFVVSLRHDKMIGNFAVITVFPRAGHFCLSVIPSMAVIEAIISRLNNCVDFIVAIGVLRILMVIRVTICVSKNVSVLTNSLFLFQLWFVCCLFFKNQIRSVLPYKLVFARTIFRFPTQSC